MNYSSIIESAMKGFYRHNLDYPRWLSYPVFTQDHNCTYDLFFVLEDTHLKEDNKLIPSLIYLQDIRDEDNSIVFDSTDQIDSFLIKTPYCRKSASSDLLLSFPILYSKVRCFVFEKGLTDEQKELALQLADFYNLHFDERYWKLYSRLSPEFFKWVDRVK